MAVTLSQLRARVETDFDDTTLQKILDAAVQAIERAAGKVDSESETFSYALGSRFVALSRRHTSISSITERGSPYADEDTLSANDYREIGEYKILRLGDGDNPRSRWGETVTVTYVPEVDEDLRDSVTMDLAQMVVEFRALDKETVGDWSGEQKDYQKRRRALLATIKEGRSVVL